MVADRIGFIGLGRMGRAMAANLASAGVRLSVHNRTTGVAEAFARTHGVSVDPDPASLASEADIIITMLADDVALREVMHGPHGVLAGLRPDSLIIDMGTVGRSAILDLDVEVRQRGARLVDAPVSGVPKVATEGRLTVMAGGDPSDVERARPAFSTFAERVIHVGPVGAGAAMKLAINTAIHGLNQALSEALVLAERSGIERSRAYEVFVAGAISGPFVVNRRAVFEHPGEGAQPFSVELAAKDIRLALELAGIVGAPLEQAQLNLDVLRRAEAAGLGQLDESAVAEYLRGRTGLQADGAR